MSRSRTKPHSTPPLRSCTDCGNGVWDRYRKLCWTCTNIRTRYRMTRAEWLQRKNLGRVCVICESTTRGVFLNKEGRSVCQKCKNTLEICSDPERLRRVIILCQRRVNQNRLDTTPST